MRLPHLAACSLLLVTALVPSDTARDSHTGEARSVQELLTRVHNMSRTRLEQTRVQVELERSVTRLVERDPSTLRDLTESLAYTPVEA